MCRGETRCAASAQAALQLGPFLPHLWWTRLRLSSPDRRHDHGWMAIVMEQPDGTLIEWAGRAEAVASITWRTGPRTRRR